MDIIDKNIYTVVIIYIVLIVKSHSFKILISAKRPYFNYFKFEFLLLYCIKITFKTFEYMYWLNYNKYNYNKI